MSRLAIFSLLAASVLSTSLVGCSSGTTEKPDAKKEEHDDHHHHGPHEGHIAGVGEEEYHVEWTQNDKGQVNLFILDAEAKKDVPVAASEVVIVTKTGDETKEYTLTAVEPVDGKTAQFETTDKELAGALDALSEAITAHVKQLEIDGKTFENVQLTEEHHH